MNEQPKMTLPNGDVLRAGDWGVTQGGEVVQVSYLGQEIAYAFCTNNGNCTATGRSHRIKITGHDIISRAVTPSLRPADETDLTALCKPFGLLHEATQAALLACPNGWEVFKDSWVESLRAPDIAPQFAHRAKPAPVSIRATIPWEFLCDEIQWVTQDEDGRWWGFLGEEVLCENTRVRTGVKSLALLTFPQGNEHWTKTLQQRPASKTEGLL